MVMSLLPVLHLGRELIILLYGIAVIASFTALGQATYRSALWHRPFVLLLTLGGALAAWVAWTRFRADGTSQSFLLLAAFAALAVLYAPHALLEGEGFDPAHLVFGPLSRLAFSLGLIAAITNVPIPGIHRLPRWFLIVLILLASGLIDLAAHSEAAARLWRANPVGFLRRIEGLALTCQLLGVGWLVTRWWWQRRPFVLALAGGVLVLATGSALFLTTAPWQGRWWVAHLGLFVCAVIISVGIVTERARRGQLGATFDLDGTAALAEHVIAAMRDGLALHDPQGRLIGWNPAAMAITGWTRDVAATRWAADLPEGLVDLGGGQWVEVRRIMLSYYGRPYTATLFTDARAQVALREAQAFLEHLIAASPVVIFRGDPHDLSLSYVSPNAARLLGYPTPEVVGVPEFWAAHLHPEDRPCFQTAIARAAADGADHLELECRFQHHDGDYRTLSMVIRLEYDASRRPVSAVGYALDVTARRVAEQGLIDRTAELEAVNRELETFSYSVSHDLRAPLRSIEGFSQALLEEYANTLDTNGQDHLQRIRGATRRMADLIDALLGLAQVTQAALSPEPVDMTAIARTIAADLQRHEPSRAVAFVIADGLGVKGDRRLLQVVLDNLLGNAWKFTAKQPQACIEVGCLMSPDGTPAFFVRDNGAGFEMAYVDKLFGAFQRLHRDGEFPGTGIGLATVQRIIHRHGGRVWAEGAVDQGATFYFTLGQSASETRADGQHSG
jgi:PAS domain S-box-containing protein